MAAIWWSWRFISLTNTCELSHRVPRTLAPCQRCGFEVSPHGACCPLPFPGADGPVSNAGNSGSHESQPTGSAMCPCVPCCSQPRGKQLSCLEKASLAVSAFSEKMHFCFKCEEESLYERRKLEPWDTSVCVFMSKTLEDPLDLQLSSPDKYYSFKTGEIACLPMTGNTSLNAFILSFHKWMWTNF